MLRLLAMVAALVGLPAAAQTSLWPASTVPAVAADTDTASVVLGVRFQSSQAGHITAIRFYKGAGNGGTHVGRLWTSTGAQLASVTFANETASGWQQANFAAPVPIAANTVYVASYHAPQGRYAVNLDYFASARVSPPLTAPTSNGVYRYGGATSFPNLTFRASNYWVDVVFVPVQAVPPAAPGAPSISLTKFGHLSFAWDHAGASGYRLYANPGASGCPGGRYTQVSATTGTVRLAWDVTHFAQVTAVDSSGRESECSNLVSAKPK